jgi:hypothetical protein
VTADTDRSCLLSDDTFDLDFKVGEDRFRLFHVELAFCVEQAESRNQSTLGYQPQGVFFCSEASIPWINRFLHLMFLITERDPSSPEPEDSSLTFAKHSHP